VQERKLPRRSLHSGTLAALPEREEIAPRSAPAVQELPVTTRRPALGSPLSRAW